MVYLLFDADAANNRFVYDAGDALRKSIGPVAKSVLFIQCPGGGTEGIDDYLASLDREDRADVLRTLMTQAIKKPAPRRPDKKKGTQDPEVLAAKRRNAAARILSDLDSDPELDESGLPVIGGEIGDGSLWMHPETGVFLPETLARATITSPDTPVAAAAQKSGQDGVPGVYRGGYFHADGMEAVSAVRRFLGDSFSINRYNVVVQEILSLCSEYGRTLPDHPSEPFLNVRNGMLDLRTLELHPHSPGYRSLRQLPVNWNPDATCPRYEDELVRHKILDAIGDLYLLGHSLIGAFVGYKSGHELNNKLLRKLMATQEAWEMRTFPDEAAVPISYISGATPSAA
jgi:putative DNA primase/helicase